MLGFPTLLLEISSNGCRAALMAARLFTADQAQISHSFLVSKALAGFGALPASAPAIAETLWTHRLPPSFIRRHVHVDVSLFHLYMLHHCFQGSPEVRVTVRVRGPIWLLHRSESGGEGVGPSCVCALMSFPMKIPGLFLPGGQTWWEHGRCCVLSSPLLLL